MLDRLPRNHRQNRAVRKTKEVYHEEALYNLISDISEQDNLITQFPERAASLKKAGETFELKIKAEARPIGIDE